MKPVKHASEVMPDFLADLDRMIEEAEDGEGFDFSIKPPSLIREANGWGERYLPDFTPEGERWIETFYQVRKAVISGGLIALIGNRGTGKTQMAAEVAKGGCWPSDRAEWNGNAMVAGKTALYRRALDIFVALRDASRGNSDSESKILEKLSYCGLLVIDEFQERGETAYEERIVTNLLDKRYNNQRPTIIIANLGKKELGAMLSPSVRDRMRQEGKSFVFDWKSYRCPNAKET